MQTPPTYNQGFNQGAPPLVSRASLGPVQNTPGGGNMYNPPRPPEVYTLPDAVNDAMPLELRQNFQRDENGRILFFTAPPLDRRDDGMSSTSSGLGHSAKYLAGRNEWLAEREKKRKERDASRAEERRKRASPTPEPILDPEPLAPSEAGHLIEACFKDFDQDTLQWHRDTGLGGSRRTQHTSV